MREMNPNIISIAQRRERIIVVSADGEGFTNPNNISMAQWQEMMIVVNDGERDESKE